MGRAVERWHSGQMPTAVRLLSPPGWRTPATTALAVAGLVVADDAPAGVVLRPGRTTPSEVDPWIVDSLPHLLLGVWDERVEVGPFALPGVSPCCRCVSAATLEPHVQSSRLPRLDPALLALAAGWTARDLVEWSHGATPATWATSWSLDADPVPLPRRWGRHPHCGCSW